MNRIRLFNPEHDLALANGDRHFIAPRNIREMGRDLAPLLDVMDDASPLMVWGWDGAVREQLRRMGVADGQLPTDAALAALRACSERQLAHHLLQAFRAAYPHGPYAGESILVHSLDDVAAYAARYGHIILKDPLSSSGKGLRHVNVTDGVGGNCSPDVESSLLSSLKKVESWANALIRRHGYLTAEPYYDKVQDFAMEFYVCDGQCRFIGYSLFTTTPHGRYEGNLLMSDERAEALLARYVPCEALHEVRDWYLSHSDRIIPTAWDTTKHPLHFGIDMMVVNFQFSIFNSQFRIHPCVEVNLRLNMGIIAHEVCRKLLMPDAEGAFLIVSFPSGESAQLFGREHAEQHPATYHAGRLVAGYHSLTPIFPHTRHHAYVMCGRD